MVAPGVPYGGAPLPGAHVRVARGGRIADWAAQQGQSILRVMSHTERFQRDDWEAILHAPFHAYTHVGSADGTPIEAQFRCLVEEIEAGQETFDEESLGRTMATALNGNLDVLWAGFQAAGRSPKDGLGRARKALEKAEDSESAAIRDWILAMAVRVAEARRVLGTGAVSPAEDDAIVDVAAWLDRPLPAAS